MPDRRYTYQVDIDVAQARRAAQQLRGIFEGELRTINAGSGGSATGTVRGVGAGASSMLGSLGSMGGLLGAGALGLSVGVVATKTFAFAKELDNLNRQARLAEQGLLALVDSQEAVAERTRLVQDAMGGTISKIEAMQQATQLSALGFADTTEEMERFIRASQGASVATGRSTDYITQQLVLAISNQSIMRLDQLGLSASEVKQRINDLSQAHADWSKEMVYQEAVLGSLEEKYGALANAAKDNASGLVRLTTAWTDMKTSVSAAGTVVDVVAGGLADMGAKLAIVQFAINETKDASQSAIPHIRELGNEAYGIAWKVMFGAASLDELNAAMERLRKAEDAYSQPPYYPTPEGEMGGATGPRRTHPDYVRPGFLGDPIARPHVPRESYADRQAAEQKAYLDRWEQILAQDSWEKWENDKRLAEQTAREWKGAADDTASAFENAAQSVVDEFKGRLRNVPGLMGTSSVTSEQMALADYGIAQDFADNWLRRIEDEVLNQQDWGLGGIGAARGALGRIGMGESVTDEGVMALLRQQWESSALFASPENLELIDKAAVQENLRLQELAKQGQENILAYFGLKDNPQAVERLQTYGVEAAGEFGVGIIAQMPSIATQAAETLAANMNSIFGQAVGQYSWLGPITDAIAAEVLSIINEGQEDGES